MEFIKIKLYTLYAYNIVRRYIHVVKIVWLPGEGGSYLLYTNLSPALPKHKQIDFQILSAQTVYKVFIRNFHSAISIQDMPSSLSGKGHVIIVLSILFIVSRKVRHYCSVSTRITPTIIKTLSSLIYFSTH